MNVFLDRIYGSSDEERDAKAQTQRFASQVFGVDPKTEMFQASGMSQVVSVLRRFKEIDHLIIFPHGVAGRFLLGGEDVTLFSFAKAFDGGDKKRPRVTKQIHIPTCSVAEAPHGLVPLAKCFSAPLIDAYTWHHYLYEVNVPVELLKRKDAEAAVDAKVRKSNRQLPKYWSQPRLNTQQMLARAGSMGYALFEWWRSDLQFEAIVPPDEKTQRLFKAQSEAKLCRVTPARIEDAVTQMDFLHVEVDMLA